MESIIVRLTYDPEYNIAHLRFRERPATVDTIRLSDEINVDIAPNGAVCGIELLNANSQFKAADDGRLVVVDQTGETHSLSLCAG